MRWCFCGLQLYVSIISNLVTFPMNFLIAFLFKRSKRRNQQTSRVGDAVVRMREAQQQARLEIPHGQNRNSRPIIDNKNGYGAQRYVDPLNADVRPSTADNGHFTEAKTEKKKVFLLPWWCIIIGWVLLWITVAVSVAFVTFYAIMFQDEKCKKWLTSLLIGFFSSVLFTAPVKALLFALLFAVLWKKPLDDDIDEDALEEEDPVLQSDEAWLHTPITTRTYDSMSRYCCSIRPFKKYFYQDPVFPLPSLPSPHPLQCLPQHCIVSGRSHSDVMPVFMTWHCIPQSVFCSKHIMLCYDMLYCLQLSLHYTNTLLIMICYIVSNYLFTIPILLLWYVVLSPIISLLFQYWYVVLYPSISSLFQYCYYDILYCLQLSLHYSNIAIMICCIVSKYLFTIPILICCIVSNYLSTIPILLLSYVVLSPSISSLFQYF